MFSVWYFGSAYFITNYLLILPSKYLKVICRIENFGSTPMQFEDTSTIQQVVSAAFRKQNIQTCDAAIWFNGRNAYPEDSLSYLNIHNDQECSIHIRPRLRGGQPPPRYDTD